MLIRLSILLFVLSLPLGAYAQNDIPRFDPFPDYQEPDVDLTTDIGDFEQIEIPHSDLYYALEQAVEHVNSLPDDLSKDYSGTSVVPDETATQLMGFAKWLFSGTSANELLGATLAPIGINLFRLLGLMIALAIAYTTIKIAIIITRMVMSIIGAVMKVIPMMGG